MREGAVADLEILAQRVQRERRAHALGQQVGQQLERREVADGLEVADVLAEEPLEPLLLPAAKRARRLGQERLRKPAELQERVERVASRPSRRSGSSAPGSGMPARPPAAALVEREGVKPVVVVAPLQGVAAAPVDVEPGGLPVTRKRSRSRCLSNSPLSQPFQPRHLWSSSSTTSAWPAGQRAARISRAVLAVVPVQVDAGGRGRAGLPGERGLADLPGPGDEDHLLVEVLADGRLQVARGSINELCL